VIQNDQINIKIMKIKQKPVMMMSKVFELFDIFIDLYLNRKDIEISDEENEEEIIRRQRLRREQLKKVISYYSNKTFHSFFLIRN
jgi:hypothetical protein